MSEQQQNLDELARLYGSADYLAAATAAVSVAAQANERGEYNLELAATRILLQASRRLGEFEAAMVAAGHVQQLALDAGDCDALLECLDELAQVYLEINKVPEALETLDKALRVDGEFNQGRLYSRFASLVADAYAKRGDYARSEFMCHRAITDLYARNSPQEINGDQALCRRLVERKISLARAAELARQYERARYLLEGATGELRFNVNADLNESFDREPITGELDHVIAFLRGRVDLALNELTAAATTLNSALELSRKAADPLIEMLTEEQIGVLAMRNSEPDKARRHFSRSIELLESRLSKLRVEEWRSALRETGRDVYAEIIAANLAVGDIPAAWEYSERARARVFLNQLGNVRLLKVSPQVPKYGPEYEEVSETLDGAFDRLHNLGSSGDPDLFAELSGEYEQLLERKARLVQDLFREAPLVASLAEIPVVKADELQALLDDQTAVLEYFIGNDTLYLFLLTRTELECIPAPIKKETLLAEITRFRQAIESREDRGRDIKVQPNEPKSTAPAASDPASQLDQLSRNLHRVLLGNIFHRLKGITRLYIVAHGMLQYLPFAALKDEHYLIEQFQVGYAPSGSVLKFLLSPQAEKQGQRAVIFANPQLGVPTLDLPFSEGEGLEIAGLWRGARLLTREQATATEFLAEAPDSDVIHLACHANFVSEYPLMSRLLLAGDGSSDGAVEVHRIYGLRLHADLVVLSACQTALSDLAEGSEFVGLIRAFITAGAASVIATLWSVSDQATSELMVAVYRNLRAGQQKADALRQAQLTLLRTPERSDPYYWSGFALYGDWRSHALGEGAVAQQ